MSRQYLNAASAVEAVISGKKSFKSYCNSVKIGKLEYALAAETLRYRNLIDDLFIHSEINVRELDMRYGLLLVMTYELLFGRKKIDSGGVVKRKLKELEPKLQSSLQVFIANKDNIVSNNYSKYADLLTENLSSKVMIRYVRVNTIRISVSDAIIQLKQQDPSYSTIEIDSQIPTLLILRSERSVEASTYTSNRPPSVALADLELVKNGSLIIQDKSSCIPSQVLSDVLINNNNDVETTNAISNQNKSNTKSHSTLFDCIDVCAAPGNKTSHLACCLHEINDQLQQKSKSKSKSSHIKKSHSIYAFEKNSERFQLLSRRMNEAGSSHIVIPTHMDFLTTDPNDEKYSCVEYALVDPSCSGSGLRSLDRLADNKHKNNHQGQGQGQVQGEVANDISEYEQEEKSTPTTIKDNNMNNNTTTIKSSNKNINDDMPVKAPLTLNDRLKNLQTFQISVIKHAMKLPRLRYLVYSTCSIHTEENEDVVATILSQQNDEITSSSSSSSSSGNGSAVNSCWDVIAPQRFTSWTRRGVSHPGLTQSQSDCLIRCDPADQTSGFFVALFKKTVSGMVAETAPVSKTDAKAVTDAVIGVATNSNMTSQNEITESIPSQAHISAKTNDTSENLMKTTKRRISMEEALLSMPTRKKKQFWKQLHKY